MKQTNKINLELPYDKFLQYGSNALTDVELLAIIIRTGTREKSARELAREILTHNGSQEGNILHLRDYTLERLLKIKGIGKVKAVKLLCIVELSRRIWESRMDLRKGFGSPKEIADYFMEELRHKKQEHVILLLLDTKSRLIKQQVLFIGTINCSLLSVREICIEALKAEAVYMILLHNHPSGDPTPSSEDIRVSRKLKEIGELMEIPLLDHIIIGDGCYISLKEQKIL